MKRRIERPAGLEHAGGYWQSFVHHGVKDAPDVFCRTGRHTDEHAVAIPMHDMSGPLRRSPHPQAHQLKPEELEVPNTPLPIPHDFVDDLLTTSKPHSPGKQPKR
ncbi:hypothetical protein [Nitrogeniibacter aestuarii]|uniref:hypothetical protein n=1 Tax=Nitrogeniibacter aestuarii TaxID=2815343 RepID=UPI001E607EFD|nr:hypothetical protein [Nitrogeniibacter aestuarii]